MKPGDIVETQDGFRGTIVSLDNEDNYFWNNYGITTCRVELPDGIYIYWTNKIFVVNDLEANADELQTPSADSLPQTITI